MLLLVRNGLKQKLKKQNSFGTSPLIDPSMDFSTFDMDQLGKIRRHHYKERLKITE